MYQAAHCGVPFYQVLSPKWHIYLVVIKPFGYFTDKHWENPNPVIHNLTNLKYLFGYFTGFVNSGISQPCKFAFSPPTLSFASNQIISHVPKLCFKHLGQKKWTLTISYSSSLMTQNCNFYYSTKTLFKYFHSIYVINTLFFSLAAFLVWRRKILPVTRFQGILFTNFRPYFKWSGCLSRSEANFIQLVFLLIQRKPLNVSTG